jgi:Holliday junction resolvasome RuvABC endonuclease subunit
MTYDKWRKYKECPTCAASGIKNAKEFEVIPKPSKVKRTLVFDQATNTTGWAVFDDNKLIQYGIFDSNGSSPEHKINIVKYWVRDMITSWRADRVVIEDIQLQNFEEQNLNTIGVTTFKALAHLQGVLIDLFYENKVPYKVAHTGTWRKHVGVKGKSRADKKKSAQLIVKEIYQRDVSQDEADAICIGRYGLTLFKELSFSNWV